jgi:hypothetical protein
METNNKQFEVFKWVLFGTAIYLIYKLLDKFGLLGKSDEEKLADELDKKTGIDTIDSLKNDKKMIKAIQISTNKKNPTVHDIKKLQSSYAQYRVIAEKIFTAKGTVASGFDDNEELVYSSLSELKSQFDFDMFSRFFLEWKKVDLFVFLKSFLNTSELAEVTRIIKNKKPA